VWTFMRGELYVACRGGCLPLPFVGFVPLENGLAVPVGMEVAHEVREGREAEDEPS